MHDAVSHQVSPIAVRAAALHVTATGPAAGCADFASAPSAPAVRL